MSGAVMPTLRASVWPLVVGDVELVHQHVASGRLTGPVVAQMDRFLLWWDQRGRPDLTRDTIEDWSAEHAAPTRLTQLLKFFEVMFAQSDVHQALIEVRRNKTHLRRQPTGTYKARVRKFSVDFGDLPQEWQCAIADMTAGIDGVGGPAPAASFVVTLKTKLAELAHSCRTAGIEIALTVETTILHERALYGRERKLSPRTMASTMRQIRSFARYQGIDPQVITHLDGRIRRWEQRVLRTPALKEAKVLSLPSYAEIMGMSFDLLGAADSEMRPRRRNKQRNFAVALALQCAFPLRLADTVLHFGREILWDGAGYHLNIVTSKTGAAFRPRVHPAFGFFIDRMVLRGMSEDQLDALRQQALAEERPLFLDYLGQPMHPHFVSRVWREVLGTGAHIARSKIHDELAYLGQEGVELAMAACTQRSQQTAEFYRSRAYALTTLRGAYDRISDTLDGADWDVFE